MAFSSKARAKAWADERLAKADKPGEWFDPFTGEVVTLAWVRGYWTMSKGDSWVDAIEIHLEGEAPASGI